MLLLNYWQIEDELDGDLEECLERCYEAEEPIEDEIYFHQLAKDSGVL